MTESFQSHRFYVLDEKAIGGKGYTVRDQAARVIYRLARKSEARIACERLNAADSK